MWVICKKEWNTFFANITGYLAVALFLSLSGLALFVMPQTSILSYGFATLEGFFSLAPWLFIFLIPVIAMRSFSEEFRAGTFELLLTYPISLQEIILGKFFAGLAIFAVALFPTIIYAISLQQLSAAGGIDVASTIGGYLGLFLIGATYLAISIYASSLVQNSVVGFIVAAAICLTLFIGFDAISKLPVFYNSFGFLLEKLSLNYHFKSIGRGVIDIQDVLYFSLLVAFFLQLTKITLKKIAE